MTRNNKVNKLSELKETLLLMVSEEKELFSKYSQLCVTYQIQTDPIATARHKGRLEALQDILKMMAIES